MVVGQKLQELFDLLRLEAADIVVIVDIARGRADQDSFSEQVRSLVGGQDADHGADRMTHEDGPVRPSSRKISTRVVGVAGEVAYFDGS
jgi:hypothetical protein